MDSIIRDIFVLKNSISEKEQIKVKLLKKYTLRQVEEAFDELYKISAKGIFKRTKLEKRLNIENMLERNITNIDIYLSNTCNMACSYCYSQGGDFGLSFKQNMMDWRTAQKTIDWFFIQNKPSKGSLTICFFGGEPLLNLSIFKKSLLYIDKKWSKRLKLPLRLALSTNGTLLNNEILNLISRNNCELIVSLDSCKVEHDARRVFKDGRPTYDIILENVRYAQRHFPEIKITLNSVVNQNSNFINIFRNRYSPLNYNTRHSFNIERNILSDKRETNLYFKSFKKELKRFYLNSLKSGKKFIYLDNEDFCSFQNRASRNFYRSNCDAGITKVSVAVKGDIYICALSHFDKKYKIGSVFSGISNDKVKGLIRKYKRLKRFRVWFCKSCWARAYCVGSCVLGFKDERRKTSLFSKRDGSFSCNMRRLSLEYVIRSFTGLDIEDAIAYFGNNSKPDKQKLDLKEKIRLTYLYRDLVNRDFKHMQFLNPLFTQG